MVTPEEIINAIKANAYSFTCEKDLQDGISQALSVSGIKHQREVVLSKADRIDFLVAGGVGVEVKIDGSVSALTRQVFRYAELESIRALVVVVTLVRLANLPREIKGKPILPLILWRAFT